MFITAGHSSILWTILQLSNRWLSMEIYKVIVGTISSGVNSPAKTGPTSWTTSHFWSAGQSMLERPISIVRTQTHTELKIDAYRWTSSSGGLGHVSTHYWWSGDKRLVAKKSPGWKALHCVVRRFSPRSNAVKWWSLDRDMVSCSCTKIKDLFHCLL